MKREIKFRAWDKKNSVLHCAESVKKHFYLDELIDSENYDLLQYTGLKDKNGTPVYEGDIARWRDAKNLYSIEFGSFGVPNIDEACYQDDAVGFYLKPQHSLRDVEPFNMTYPLNGPYADMLEIVGNIYEHSHLLEAEQ